MCKKDNPIYFEKMNCSRCGEFELEYVKHKYTDEVICVDCLNKLANEVDQELPVQDKWPSYDHVTGERIE